MGIYTLITNKIPYIFYTFDLIELTIKNMNKIILVLLLFSILISCSESDINQDRPDLPSVSKSDTTKITTEGDTVLTGKPIKFEGEVQEINTAKASKFKINNTDKTTLPIENTNQIKRVQKSIMQPTSIVELADTIPFHDTILKGDTVRFSPTVKQKINELGQSPNKTHDIKYLSVNQGLNSNELLCLFEDRSNIWIGTNDGGIMKYDGEYLETFTTDNGFPGNSIRNIFKDSKGNLWFSSYGGGISKFDGEEFINFSTSNGLNHNWVFGAIEDPKGNIWVFSQNGINKIYTEEGAQRISSYSIEQGMSSRYILSMTFDKKGNLWFGTYGRGVGKFDGERFYHFESANSIIGNSCFSVYNDYNNKLWIGSEMGVTNIDNDTIYRFEGNDPLFKSEIHQITEGVDHSILIGSQHGVGEYSNNEINVYNLESGLNSNSINSLMSSNNRFILVGTNNGGLNIINTESFSKKPFYAQQDKLDVDKISNLKNSIAIATKSGELYLQSKDELRLVYRDTNNTSVQEIIQGVDGSIWIADYYNGLTCIKGDSVRHFNVNDGLYSSSLMSLFEDSKEQLWIGTSNAGLFQYDNDKFISYRNQLSYNTPTSFLEDSQGNIWFTIYGWGLIKYKDDSITHYTENENLEGIYPWTVKEISKNKYIIGSTDQGVSIFNGQTFSQINEKAGLISNDVRSILKIDDQILVGTGKGISILNNKDEKYEVLMNFDHKDFAGLNDFINNSIVICNQNEYWWLTTNGVIAHNENIIRNNNDSLDVKINGILINNEFIDFHNLQKHKDIINTDLSVNPFKNLPNDLNLDFENNSVSFQFSAQNYSAQNRVYYSYKLIGIDKEWSKASKDPKVEFLHLPFGTYKLLVKAKTEGGNWSPTTDFGFKIRPPWYESVLAKIVYFILIIGVVYLMLVLRTRKLKKRQVELERKVDLATAEIREQKDEIEEKKNEAEYQRHLVEEKNKEILDSINYAKRLQDAILPPTKLVSSFLMESFILYKPKDIVAGDFYFMDVVEENEKKLVYYVAADCTGHGVPGAMVSIVGANGLKRCIQEFGLRDPGQILNKLSEIVAENFAQSEERIRDGMDLALCCLEMENDKASKVHYAGANNPLWIINPNRKEAPENAIPFKYEGGFEIKANKQAIGYTENITPFDTHTFDVIEGDTLYTFSDGYPDQFGGEKGKKYKSANFKKLLLDIYDKNMDDQKLHIDEEFESWKGDLEQVDDVCVIGVRL